MCEAVHTCTGKSSLRAWDASKGHLMWCTCRALCAAQLHPEMHLSACAIAQGSLLQNHRKVSVSECAHLQAVHRGSPEKQSGVSHGSTTGVTALQPCSRCMRPGKCRPTLHGLLQLQAAIAAAARLRSSPAPAGAASPWPPLARLCRSASSSHQPSSPCTSRCSVGRSPFR